MSNGGLGIGYGHTQSIKDRRILWDVVLITALVDTLNFIIKMCACRSYMDIGWGVFTVTTFFYLDPKNGVTYILLSNIYVGMGRWCEAQMVRRLINDKELKRSPDVVGLKVVKWCVLFLEDRSHPQTHEIYAKLERLAWETKVVGHSPYSRYLLSDVEKEGK